jgi:hypothetical protein
MGLKKGVIRLLIEEISNGENPSLEGARLEERFSVFIIF